MQRGDRVGGRFEIVDRVASGGMGTVFRARDVRTQRDTAVKIIAADRPEEALRFAREAAILAGFSHPGVVGYIAHGAGYLVMEWVSGETLRQRLDRTGMSPREAVAIARQLAEALSALHAAGIVHRDVKPANLMLADQLKLVDFGVARTASAPRFTLTGTHIGTAGYMAPEQARGDREVTGAADVFALGCVLYECLAGSPVFRGDSAMALRAKVLLDDPPRPRTLVPAIPAALDELVMDLLAREPELRPSATQAAARLAAIDAVSDTAAPAAITEAAATEVSRHAEPACAVLIALDDPAEIDLAAFPGGTAAQFAGGAVATRSDATGAAELALAIAAQLPEATIAIACGRSPSEAIDRTARLVEQLEIAAATGERVAGAWIDDGAAGALSAGFAIEPRGSRARLRGVP